MDIMERIKIYGEGVIENSSLYIEMFFTLIVSNIICYILVNFVIKVIKLFLHLIYVLFMTSKTSKSYSLHIGKKIFILQA